VNDVKRPSLFGQQRGCLVKLDDPSFNAPIFANLFDGEDDI
jgi:uncharacterized protein (DUF736 family)